MATIFLIKSSVQFTVSSSQRGGGHWLGSRRCARARVQ